MSRWPWIVTILSGLLILNPYSLILLAGLIGYGSADEIAAVALLGGGLLVFLGVMEWLIRTEVANARLQRAHERPDGNA